MVNLGGFAGPYAIGFLTDLRGTYVAGILLLVGPPSLHFLRVLHGARDLESLL
jgi:hypothetical protein